MSDKKDADLAKRAQLIRNWADNFSPTHTRELSKLIAAERKIKFDEHINAGFSEAQALVLCKD